MLSLDNLREPISRAEALERVLELMQGLGFDTTGWQEGRIQRTLITVFALIMADMSEANRVIADSGFNEFATGRMLELFSNSRYQNQKFAARATSGLIPLTSTSTVAYPIVDGELIAATANGVEFRSVGAYTIAANAVTNVRFTARVKGSDGNVGTGTINTLLTPLAGVTISNTGDPWYDVSGVDLESDASLRLRNSTQWARLSVELIADAYENIARDNGASKVKVHDENPRGAGTIDVYVAGEFAKLSNAEVTVIQEAFAERAFQTDSDWPPASTSRVTVKHPTIQALTLSGVLYHDPGVTSAVIRERAIQALRDFLAATPIGGYDYSPGPSNVIMYSDLIDVLKDVEGVYTVNLTTPSANVSVGTLNLVTEGVWTGLTAVPQIST
jgi:phage-related baseplate assembly protein